MAVPRPLPLLTDLVLARNPSNHAGAAKSRTEAGGGVYPSNHQGWYGEAFVRALAGAAGLRVAKPEPDIAGIDFNVWPDLRNAARAPSLAVRLPRRVLRLLQQHVQHLIAQQLPDRHIPPRTRPASPEPGPAWSTLPNPLITVMTVELPPKS